MEDYNIKFQESMVANDYLFSVKCGHLASKIDFATDIFYTYTERKDSLSNVMLDKTEKVASRLEVYYQVEKYCSANGVCVHPFSLLVSSIVIKRRKFVHCVRSICRKYKLNFVRVIILSYYYRFLVYCLNLRRLPC